MPRYNPYTLQMQLTRMFAEGQSFFATQKVRDWLQERNENPDAYDIIFHSSPAPPGSQEVLAIVVELRRLDGQPVESWLQEEANRHA